MRALASLLLRFQRDERGAFAMIFAVMAVVIIAMSGAVVDFTGVQQARTRAQVALDAAALTLQPSIYTATAATIKSQAQALLVDRLADAATTWVDCTTNSNKPPCATVSTPTIDTTNGVLTLTANLKVAVNFVSLVGVQNIPAQIISVSTRKKLGLEVAMVLDNSGSMDYTMGYNSNIGGSKPTRMATLQSSATCASNILFYGVTTCSASTTGLTANPSVKIGLVPFTEAVNVGSANSSATWIDRTGSGNITDNNMDSDDFDNNGTTVATVDTFAGPVDRIALFAKIKDKNGTALSWGGCVEARVNDGASKQYDTDDTTPSTSQPDTLFTPYFAPDEPGSAEAAGTGTGGFYNSYIDDTGPTCKTEPVVVWTEVKTKCSSSTSSSSGFTSASCSGGTVTDTYAETDQSGIVTAPASLPATIYNNPVPATYGETVASTKIANNNYTLTRTRTYTYIFSNREYQERLCKYDSSQMTSAVSQGSVFGPNGDCPAAGILALSATPATVNTAIGNMAAMGGTNITEGAAWGFRVLSPTAPFTEGAAYSSTTAKVMILMTDGENTTYPGTNMNYDQYYSAYGFPWNSRLGVVTSTDTTLEAVMNTRLTTVCTNAKAAGITVYTIGVDTADTTSPSATTTLLTNCATNSTDAFFPNTATDLQAAFVSIANQLAALRLAR
jgi:Flp pilus assembly protein TadG